MKQRPLANSWPKEDVDPALRPTSFQDFVGQETGLKNLNVFIQAAFSRGEALDHVLLSGPPGLGKTTLAHLIAAECGSVFHATAGPIITKPGDLAALLTHLGPKDVLFIDEIHRLPVAVEELLYAAMEDYKLDILMGEGPHARSMQLTLPPFTLVGATTRSGLLSSPLRNRFGILMPLHFYAPKEMEALLFKASLKLNMTLSPEAQHQMAVCCRGTPRLALRLLRRVRDFAQVQGSRHITIELSSFALLEMGMTLTGLDPLDQRYLSLLGHHFKGGPTGLETLASAMSETKDTLEDIIEPYLMQQGLLQRTARGRLMTEKGWLILNAS